MVERKPIDLKKLILGNGHYDVLIRAVLEKDLAKAMDILVSIYCYLLHKAPSRKLKKEWKYWLASAIEHSTIPDFLMILPVGKYQENGRHYYISSYACYNDKGECYAIDCSLDYCNGALAGFIDGKDNWLTRRNEQLLGRDPNKW